MASVITNDMRRRFLDEIKLDIDSGSTNYYVGLSRAVPYSSITSGNEASLAEQIRFRNEMSAIKTISNVSYVIDRVNWSGGTVYNEYDHSDPSQENYYVVNSFNEVFLCVYTGRDDSGVKIGSTVEPTALLAGDKAETFKTTDGYHWKLLYTASPLAISNFASSTYYPVSLVEAGATINEEIEQKALQDSSVAGQILSIQILNGGSSYSVEPAIEFSGNGTGASASAVIENNTVVSVELDSDNGFFQHGSGYDYVKVTPSSGNAQFRGVIGPSAGVSADPVETLRANKLMVQLDFVNDEGSTLLTENDFKQVGLIRGITTFGTDTLFSGNTAQTLNYLLLTGDTVQFTEDDEVSNLTGTATAKVFHHDNTVNHYLYYYQNDSTGFGDFIVGDTVTDGVNNASIATSGVLNPPVDRYSGEILYINNLTDAVDRASNQTEDIRIIFQLG